MENNEFKVGDIVRIKPKSWFDNKYGYSTDGFYYIGKAPGWARGMSKYFRGKTKIKDIFDSKSLILFNNKRYIWLNEWVEKCNCIEINDELFKM